MDGRESAAARVGARDGGGMNPYGTAPFKVKAREPRGLRAKDNYVEIREQLWRLVFRTAGGESRSAATRRAASEYATERLQAFEDAIRAEVER